MKSTGSQKPAVVRMCTRSFALASLFLALLCGVAAHAQELEPRAFAPNPTGVNFLVLGYTHTDGDVLLSATSPIDDFRIRADMYAAGIGGSFAVGSLLASAGLVLPYVDGIATGRVSGEDRKVLRSGGGDIRMRFTLSLLPGSALDPAEFSKHMPDSTLAVSLVAAAPTGEYLDDKLVNIGTNRWAFRPEIGGTRRVGRWMLEGSGGVWFFTDNDNFYGGRRREQDPLATVQAHLSYTFRPRLWASVSGTWYGGGATTLDGLPERNRQNNTRAGATLSVPIGRAQSLKFAWSSGTTTRIGGDFETLGVVWTYVWLP